MKIPRIVIGGTQSGVGKTTLTAGLIRVLAERGLKVQPFKIGPDYIDPSFHSQAAGRQAHNLDSWLVGEEHLEELFAVSCEGADIAVIEGVMGIFDGGQGGKSSTAEIASLLDAPLLLVHNCQSAGESAAAAILGFYRYQEGIQPAGVILNRLGSPKHGEMIVEPLEKNGAKVVGRVPRSPGLGLEERHLGLVPAAEKNPEEVIQAAAKVALEYLEIEKILQIAKEAPEFTYSTRTPLEKEFSGIRIGVARDEAFSFEYPASLAILEEVGAELIFFSPIHDKQLPDVDGLFLGGGFPELFLPSLSENMQMLQAIQNFHSQKKPIWAECGGFLYLCRTLKDFSGKSFSLVGIVPASTEMTKQLQAVGYVSATAEADSILASKGEILRGHHFHFSQIIPEVEDFSWAFRMKSRRGEEVDGYQSENLIASYLHIHLLGNLAAGVNFLTACKKVKEQLAK